MEGLAAWCANERWTSRSDARLFLFCFGPLKRTLWVLPAARSAVALVRLARGRRPGEGDGLARAAPLRQYHIEPLLGLYAGFMVVLKVL